MSSELITRFYEAFQRRDAEGMIACYHPGATFSDPVFRDLDFERLCGMWRMLCERGKDLEVQFSDVVATGQSAHANWDAVYSFSQTGRRVHNRIHSEFTLRDDRIFTHRDAFDLWGWTRQALGAPGVVLGWNPLFQRAVRRNAMKALARYMAR